MRRNSWPEHVLCLCIATGPRLHVKQGSAGPRIPWSPSQGCSPPSLSPLGGISAWAFLLRVFGGGRPWLSMAGQPASLPLTRASSQALAIHRRWLDQAEGLLARVSESGSTDLSGSRTGRRWASSSIVLPAAAGIQGMLRGISEVVSGHQDNGLDLVQRPLEAICTAPITASGNSQCLGCQEDLAFIDRNSHIF